MLWLAFNYLFGNGRVLSRLVSSCNFVPVSARRYANKMSAQSITWPKTVLFGDSLTQRAFEPTDGLWGAVIADKLQRVSDVIARGFSGYNSDMCKIILPRLFTSKNIGDVHAFVILLGSNDSCSKENARKVHVPLDRFKENLIYMVNYLKSIGLSEEKIILMTPPPYFHEAFVAYCEDVGYPYPIKDNETTGLYAKACITVGNQCSVDVVDLYSEMLKEENWPEFLVDGLHFSRSGSMKVASLLWPYLKKRFPYNKLILPHWSEVDPLDPEPFLTKPC